MIDNEHNYGNVNDGFDYSGNIDDGVKNDHDNDYGAYEQHRILISVLIILLMVI